jgi:hypothetical protein
MPCLEESPSCSACGDEGCSPIPTSEWWSSRGSGTRLTTNCNAESARLSNRDDSPTATLSACTRCAHPRRRAGDRDHCSPRPIVTRDRERDPWPSCQPSHEKRGNRVGRPAPGEDEWAGPDDIQPSGKCGGDLGEPSCDATASSTTRPLVSTASLSGFTVTINAGFPLS